jgi:hypothetical protein
MTPLKRFRGVNDTAEIYMTLLKSQTEFTSLYLLLKGKSIKNISMANIPRLY